MTFRRQLEIQTRQYLMILRRYYQFNFLRMIMISLFKSICFRNKNWNIYRRNDMVDMVSRIYFQIIEEEEVNLHVDETSWPRTNNCSWVIGIWGFIKLCCLPLYWFAIFHNKKLKCNKIVGIWKYCEFTIILHFCQFMWINISFTSVKKKCRHCLKRTLLACIAPSSLTSSSGCWQC